MRIVSLTLLGLAALAAPAQELTPADITPANIATPGRLDPKAVVYNGPRAKVSMYSWSNKYVYRAGDALTLKWTVKTNGDLYPYTTFVYRQNNQTGVKTYLPGNTETPTDINGNAPDALQPAVLTDAAKATLIGAGGKFPALTMPADYGMHTIAVQLRDYTGTRVLKTSYMKIGVVRNATTITGDITADRTLTADTQWDLKGIVYVKNGATLTVEPGTFVFGQPGTSPPSALIITQSF